MPDMTIGTSVPRAYNDGGPSGSALLGSMKPIPAPKWVPPDPGGGYRRNASGDMEVVPPSPGYFISSNGTRLDSPDGGKTFTDTYDSPLGKSNRDKADVTYKLDGNGMAVPVAATPRYQAGDWVQNREGAAILAAVLTAGAGGAAFGGSAAAGEGAAAGAGAAGAGSAGVGAGEAAAGGGGLFGTGGAAGGGTAAEFGAGSGLSSSGAGFGSAGYDFGAGTGATFGGSGAGAGVDALGYGSGTVGAGAGSGIDGAYTAFQQAAQAGGGVPSSGVSTTDAAKAATGASQATTSGSDASNAASLAKLLSGGVGTALAGAGAAALSGGGGDLGTPNYAGAAQAQSASGRMDQSNPWGSLTYAQNGVDSQGNPVYKQSVALNSADQSNLDSARKGQGSALFGLNNSISGYDDAVKKLPGLYGDSGTQAGLTQQSIDAMYHKQSALLDPQYQQQHDALRSQLANQGVVQGSQAYNTAMDSFSRQRDYAYGNARDSSINQGNALAGQLFGQNLQAHNTGMQDLSTQQNQYLTDANGLSNTVKQPNFANTPAPTNYLGAAALQGQGNLNQYNAKTGAANSTSNGLYGLGGAILSNPTWTSYLGNLFSTGG